MTCKDCIHRELCADYVSSLAKVQNADVKYISQWLDEIEGKKNQTDNECEHFADRSRFVKLPCKVGDTVYFNNVHLRYAKVIAIYIDASGGMFDLDVVTNIETVAGYEHFINKDYTFEDIGKRLFLTKEAAEQALKEREENAE